MPRYVLAHDVGTTGDKATLFDQDGVLVRSTFAAYPTSYLQAGWVEQNPLDWWQALCQSTSALLHEAGVAASEVACVVFSGQMMGAVAVDARCQPLHKALIWADMRAESQIAEVAARIDPARVYALTGHRLSASYSAAKMRWLLDHGRVDAVHKFVQAKDFLAARLTGAFVTDHSDASGTNLYDLQRRAWSPELLRAFALPEELLPEIRDSTAVVGEVLPEAARQTGLRPGTPVVIGGGDGCCAATGAGVVRPGMAYNYLGSSSWIAVASEQPVLDPRQRTFTWAHLVPGMFSPCGTMQAAGASYQWARDELAASERQAAEHLGRSAYELMDQAVAESPPGARGLLFLPYLLGERSPRWDPRARGAFLGLTIRHRQPDLLRAVLEGISFNLRLILEAFQTQGAEITSLRLIGGGARGAVWNQIMADIFGISVLRLTPLEEATSMGAAVAGGIGVGLWSDFSQAERMITIERETPPRPENRRRYDELYQIFEQSYQALAGAEIFSRLAAVEQSTTS
jgi:xylulokinase